MKKRFAAAFGAGLVFAGGLGISGMTDPRKVIGALDITGRWDASLAFVMLGAITVHAVFVRVARRRGAPVLATRFLLPRQKRVDARLIGGAALFGLGWGAAGYCPGPGIVALAGGTLPPLVFVATMLLGIVSYHRWRPPSPVRERQRG
jgi:uncharacterized protein